MCRAQTPEREVTVALWFRKIMVGDPGGDMRWEDTLTRAEAVKTIIVMAGLVPANEAVGTPFSDVSGHWGAAYISAAVGNGYVQGYPDGMFRPNAMVSQAEFAVMIARFYKQLACVQLPPTPNVRFSPTWSVDEISGVPFLVKALDLAGPSSVSLEAPATRAWAGALLYQAIKDCGLLYDMEGTVASVEVGHIEVLVNDRLVSIDFAEDAVVLYKGHEQAKDLLQFGERVGVIISATGECNLLSVE